MSSYIEIDLDKEEKQAILKHANFFIMDKITKADLENNRKKWIRFKQDNLPEIIGELSYHFNRCKSDYQFHLLDQLIMHLEYFE